jgi:hypothetical protein
MEKKEKLNISSECSEVTLEEFIDCVTNGNLRRLVRSGSPTEAELQAAWEKLYAEYSELSGNKEHKYYFSLHKSVHYMGIKLRLAQMIMENSMQIELLEHLGYKGTVKQMVSQIKHDAINMQTKEKEMQRMTDKKTGTINDSYFDDWIVAVGKYLGYPVKRKEMLLSEFLSANRAMTKEHEMLSRSVKK